MDDRRKVLIIIYHFPPETGGGGVMRTVKFAKNLSQFGWEPVVLTSKRWFCRFSSDRSLLEELKDIKIYRVPDVIFSLLVPAWRALREKMCGRNPVVNKVDGAFPRIGAQAGWYIPCLVKAVYICLTNKIDVVFSTSPTHTSHLVAMSLHKILNVPWICDFRDAWSDNPIFMKGAPGFLKVIHRYFERKVVQSADHVTSVTKSISESLKERYPKAQVSNIYNGYDEDDFNGLHKIGFDKFTIAYIGKTDTGRRGTVLRLISALKALPQEIAEDISVLMVGPTADGIILDISNSEVKNIFRLIPPMSHKEALQYMVSSDVLLSVIGSGDDPRALSGKIFEYLRAQKPILSICPKGKDLWNLLSSFEGNFCVEPNNVPGLRDAIVAAYRGRHRVSIPLERFSEFNRKDNTEKLADILNDVSVLSR
jgi:hypothetical protein